MRSTTREHRIEFIYFVLCGGVAAIINITARAFLSSHIDYAASIVVAYLIGMVTAFSLNRIFVFNKSNNKLTNQIFWFIIINLAGIAQTLAISLLFSRIIFTLLQLNWHKDMLAHALGVAFPIISSYLGHKYFSFRTIAN